MNIYTILHKYIGYSMKSFIIIVLIAVGAYFGYQQYFASEVTVKITGNITVSQQNNYNINAPQVSTPLYIATIQGTAQNTSSKPIKNVFIKYTISGETTSAMIFNLGPGEQLSYTTKSVKTRAQHPSFHLENLLYEDSN